MCRIAAYIGAPLSLEQFLCQAPHSLYRQSWAPRGLRTAVVNADGWGAGWFDPQDRPAVYRNTLPIWADRNLDSLGRSLTSPVWVGNVRSATAGLGTHDVNTQPFCDQRLLFVHNGFITDFSVSLRRALRLALPESVEAQVLGNTDSEYIFALVRAAEATPAEAVRAALARLGDELRTREISALLNLIVTDGTQLVACRAAVGEDCPTLVWHPGHPDFAGGQLVASEAFDEHEGWRVVPEQHLLCLAPERAPDLSAL